MIRPPGSPRHADRVVALPGPGGIIAPGAVHPSSAKGCAAVWIPPGGAAGGPEVVMTTGTFLAFIVTGIIVLVAIVGGIWLETRLPGPQDQRRSPPGLLGQPRPQAMFAGDLTCALHYFRDRVTPTCPQVYCR